MLLYIIRVIEVKSNLYRVTLIIIGISNYILLNERQTIKVYLTSLGPSKKLNNSYFMSNVKTEYTIRIYAKGAQDDIQLVN